MFVCAWLDICVTCTTTHILARGSDFNVGNFQFGQENRVSDDVYTPPSPQEIWKEWTWNRNSQAMANTQ